MNGTVFCETVGGLGNQLFTIAAALEYGRRTKRECIFKRAPTSGSVMGPRSSYWNTLFAALPQADAPPTHVSSWHTYADKDTNTSIPDMVGHPHIRLSGYFQNPAYFRVEHVAPLLFPSQFWCLALAHLVVQDVAFMHFRRGDYKSLQHTHNLLPISYYERGSGEFSKHVPFLVFAEAEDMPDICREITQSKILLRRKIKFVDTQIPEHLQLLMMAQCKQGGIIANSSFSTWAAYLLPRHLTVVAPAKWFAISSIPAKLTLPHWRII